MPSTRPIAPQALALAAGLTLSLPALAAPDTKPHPAPIAAAEDANEIVNPQITDAAHEAVPGVTVNGQVVDAAAKPDAFPTAINNQITCLVGRQDGYIDPEDDSEDC